MDNDGQLTFSDDSALRETNKALQFIEEGNFEEAVYLFDNLLSMNPEMPGVADGYRTARFWLNRIPDLMTKTEGIETAEFFMTQWNIFEEYADEKELGNSMAYKAVMKYIFHNASEHYRKAFQENENPAGNFDLLLNLGHCFLRLKDFQHTIDILEYARSSYRSNAMLLATLGEAYFFIDDKPRSLLLFREAFLINPSDIDISLIESKPVHQIIESIENTGRYFTDVREWIGVYGFLTDIFYVRKNLHKHQVDTLESEIYSLELHYQKLNKDQIRETNVLPRLYNRYLWMYEYYEVQNYNFGTMTEIRDRLLSLDRELFITFFQKKKPE